MADHLDALATALAGHWLVMGWLAVMGIIATVLVWLEVRIRQLERAQDE